MKTKFRFSLLILILVSVSIASAQQNTPKCGKWRWEVKTTTDMEGLGLLTQTPSKSSIDELVVIKPPKVLSSRNTYDGKLPRYPSEKQVVEIVAYVTEVKHENDDSDLHFVLKSTTSANTMVGEIPDPACQAFDKFPNLRKHFVKTRQDGNAVWEKLKTTKKPVKVKITGVPFWDGEHATNPTGASKYCREIHPVFSIVIL